MKAEELRQCTVDELKSRVSQWKDDLFRSRFNSQASEAKDTSVTPKLRRDIARALTILNQKQTEVSQAPQDKGTKKVEGSKDNG